MSVVQSINRLFHPKWNVLPPSIMTEDGIMGMLKLLKRKAKKKKSKKKRKEKKK